MFTLGKLTKRHFLFILINTFLISCIGLLITSKVLAAEELENNYHVYFENEYIGKVNDENIVQQIIINKIASKQKEYKDLKLAIGESIHIIPEKVFNPTYDNKKIAQYLNDNITIQAKAIQVRIKDKVLGYFSSEDIANRLLETYQLMSLNKEERKYIEQINKGDDRSHLDLRYNETSSKRLSFADKDTGIELSVGDEMIKEIFFSEEITISEQKVAPDVVLNEDEGLKLLSKGTLEEKKHTVAPGEVLGQIAKENDLSMKKLLELNPELKEDSILQIDQKINVTEYKPFVDVITIKEKLVEEEIDYETEVIESDEMYKGEEKVKQKGKNGTKKVLYELEDVNGKITNENILEEEIVAKPVNKVVIKGTKVIPHQGSGELVWPTNGGYVSSYMGARWGRMHKGIDIARPTSRVIKAADHGVVLSAGRDGSYGNKIVIDHNNGMKTVYAHLASIDVKVGQAIEKGSKIGVMGSTGNSTGIHLHFEVYQNGKLKNPMKWF